MRQRDSEYCIAPAQTSVTKQTIASLDANFFLSVKQSKNVLTTAVFTIAVQSISSSAATLNISICFAGTYVSTPTVVVRACFICDV